MRPDRYLAQIDQLKEKLKSKEVEQQVLQYQFQEFKQYVATLLPNELRKKDRLEKDYPLRSLASVVQKSSSSNLLEMRAGTLFESAKKEFRNKNFKVAASQFAQLARQYPYFAKTPEVFFFLVESYYQVDDFEQVVVYVNKMVDLYPELELTGYALLRAAKVFEKQDRHDEAVVFYETVLKTFPQREIASTAEAALRAIEL